MKTMIIFLIAGFSLAVLGVFFYRGKLLNLIAGYNTLPKEEKEKVDKKRLGRLTGLGFIAVGLVTVLCGIMMKAFPGHAKLFSVIEAFLVIAGSIIVMIKVNRKD